MPGFDQRFLLVGSDPSDDSLALVRPGSGVSRRSTGRGLRGLDLMKGLAQDPASGTLFGLNGGELVAIDSVSGAWSVVGALPFDAATLAYDAATQRLYSFAASGELVTIDPDTGEGALINVIGVQSLGGLTFDPATGTLLAMARSFPTWSLIRLDPQTGLPLNVYSSIVGIFFTGLAYDTSTATLYATDGNGNLYVVSQTTGLVELVGNVGFSGLVGLTYEAGCGCLYAFEASGARLVRVDPTTGAAVSVAQLGFGNVYASALDPATGALFAVDQQADLLVRVDRTTGIATPVGPTGLDGVDALAFDAASGSLFASRSAAGELASIDPLTGAGTAVGGFALPAGARIQGLACDPAGALYGIESTLGELHAIDTSTGAASLVGGTGILDLRSLAYDPVAGELWAGQDSTDGTVVRIDPSTGQATVVGTDSPYTESLAFDPATGQLLGTDLDSDLIQVDPLSGAATTVGALGLDRLGGLAWDPTSGTLYGADEWLDRLIAIDPATGAGTVRGKLGFGGVVGLAFDPVGGVLYGVDYVTDQLLTIDMASGAATALMPLSVTRPAGLAYDPGAGLLYLTDSLSPDLYAIDPLGASEWTVGSMGFSFIESLAFDPVTARLYGGGTVNGEFKLLSIDPSSGQGSEVGPTRYRLSGLAATR